MFFLFKWTQPDTVTMTITAMDAIRMTVSIPTTAESTGTVTTSITFVPSPALVGPV